RGRSLGHFVGIARLVAVADESKRAKGARTASRDAAIAAGATRRQGKRASRCDGEAHPRAAARRVNRRPQALRTGHAEVSKNVEGRENEVAGRADRPKGTSPPTNDGRAEHVRQRPAAPRIDRAGPQAAVGFHDPGISLRDGSISEGYGSP